MRRVVLIALLLCLPLASAQVFRAGEDAGGDSSNQIAPGADVGAAITNDRTDILYVDFEETETHLNVRLGLATSPAGTSGYLYRVVFDIGGTSYYTCWAVQYTGGDEQATQENVLGCSRFTSGTAVGPATRSAGIESGGGVVMWPVPRSAIGDAGLADIESSFADTWFRGVSNCCVGSTTNSQYMWNQADRAPDAGRYEDVYVLPQAALELNLTAQQNRSSAPPGGLARFTVNATASMAANVTFALTMADNTTALWNTTGLEPWDGSGNVTQRNITVMVPGDANGTYALWLTAKAGNVTASLELTIDVTPDAIGSFDPGAGGQDNATEEEVQDDPDAKDTPLPLWLVFAAILLARRRR